MKKPDHMNRKSGIRITIMFIYIMLSVSTTLYGQDNKALLGEYTGSPIPTAGYNESLIPYQNEAGLWGYLDAHTGQVAIAAKYQDARFFNGGTAIVAVKNPDATRWHEKYLYGLIDTTGKELFPPEFTGKYEVETRSGEILEGLIHFTDKKGWGIAQTSGDWLIPPGTYSFDNNGYPAFEFYDREHYLIGNRVFFADGKKYLPPKEYRILRVDMDNRMFLITPNGGLTFGISDWKGKIIVPAAYDKITYYPEVRRFVASKNLVFSESDMELLSRLEEKGEDNLSRADSIAVQQLMKKLEQSEGERVENYLLDEHGKEIARYRSHDNAFVWGDFLTIEQQNGPQYYSLETGEQVPSHEIWIGEYHRFKENGLYGLADPSGKKVVPPVYPDMEFLSTDCIIVTDPEHTGLKGVINADNKQIVPFSYQQLHGGPDHFVALRPDKEGYGMINRNGDLLIDFQYKNMFHFRDGLAEVYDGRYSGVIDSLGNEVIPLRYNTIFNSKTLAETDEIYFEAEQDGKWGLFDKEGKQVLPFEYGNIYIDKEDFKQGWVRVEDSTRTYNGLVNIHTGVEIVPTTYDFLNIYDHVIVARIRRERGKYYYQLLDFNGQSLTETLYDEIKSMGFQYGNFIARKNKKYGVLDSNGKVLLPFKYDYLWEHTPHLLLAEQKNYGRFYLTIHGREYRHD